MTACAKTWLGHEAELEELLRTANVTRVEQLEVGVTRPTYDDTSSALDERSGAVAELLLSRA